MPPSETLAPRRVVVTGAHGYVGSRLVPRLLADGHEVRATRRPGSRAARPWWSEQVETVEMDVLSYDQVAAGLEGADTVYYLVHGMGGTDFAATDRGAARQLARAAAEAGVARIIYLSGMVPDVPRELLSEHLASRLEVEDILGGSGVPTLSLRAAVLLGSGSASFEIIRQVSERLPVHAVPAWLLSTVQPLAVTDALEALAGALGAASGSRSYDLGGPEVLPYADLLARYAAVARLPRPRIGLPLVPAGLVGELASRFTDVPTTLVRSLFETLRHDMVAAESDFVHELLPVGWRLTGVDDAIRRALQRPDPRQPAAEQDPLGPLSHDPAWAGGGHARAGATAVLTAAASVAGTAVGVGRAAAGTAFIAGTLPTRIAADVVRLTRAAPPA